jgi:hypothetical protein
MTTKFPCEFLEDIQTIASGNTIFCPLAATYQRWYKVPDHGRAKGCAHW